MRSGPGRTPVLVGNLTLIVVADDLGGSMNALARDLRRKDHGARVISFAPDLELGFPIDLYQGIDAGRELLSVAGQATHVHLVDCGFEMLGPWASPLKAKIEVGRVSLSMHFDGALATHQAKQELEAWKARARACWATRPQLASDLGVDFVAPYIPIERGPYRPLVEGTRLREAKNRCARFFYSGRFPLTQYPALEALVDRWDAREGHDVQVLHRAAHGTVLNQRRLAHVTGCTGNNYFCRSALEAWAAGLRVVSTSTGPWMQAYSALAQGQAAPVIDRAGFDACLGTIKANTPPDHKAREWVAQVLDPKRWWSRFERDASSNVSAA